MSTCIYTKYKAAVNNNNLVYRDKIAIKILAPCLEVSGFRFIVGTKNGDLTSTVTSKENALHDNNGNSIEKKECHGFTGANGVYSTVANDIIFADNKYALGAVYFGNTTSGTVPEDNLVDFNFAQLSSLNLSRFDAIGAFASPAFDDFSWLEGSKNSLTKLTLSHNGDNWTDVDPMGLAMCIALTDLSITGTLFKPFDLKDFALAQIANGRETASIDLSIPNNVLWNSQAVTAGNWTLAWTSASNITLTSR